MPNALQRLPAAEWSLERKIARSETKILIFINPGEEDLFGRRRKSRFKGRIESGKGTIRNPCLAPLEQLLYRYRSGLFQRQ
jgi:hypothetical protein